MANTKKCPRCNGSGAREGSDVLENCRKCSGSGVVKRGIEDQLTGKQKQTLGGVGGAALGFSVGGPAGMILGGLFGVAISDDDTDSEIGGN